MSAVLVINGETITAPVPPEVEAEFRHFIRDHFAELTRRLEGAGMHPRHVIIPLLRTRVRLAASLHGDVQPEPGESEAIVDSAREIAAAYLRRPTSERRQIMQRLGVEETNTVDALTEVRERGLVPKLAKMLGIEPTDQDADRRQATPMTGQVWHDEAQRFADTGRLDEGACECGSCGR